MKQTFILAVTLIFVTLCSNVSGVTISMSPKAIKLQDKAIGDFTLQYPGLNDGSTPYKLIKPVVTVIDEHQAKMVYHWDSQGQKITATLVSDEQGNLHVSFDRMPQGIRSVIFRWLIPFRFASGGKWVMGDAMPQDFPKNAPEKLEIGASHSNSFKLIDGSGKTLGMTIHNLASQYLQLQDNRHHDWKMMQLQIVCNLSASTTPSAFMITWQNETPDQIDKASIVRVDSFGQPTWMDFPGKVLHEDELREDVKHDETYYTSLTEQPRDHFGGLPGSSETYSLKKTGYFHLEQLPGGKTILVTPEGNMFFQLGVCSVLPYGYTFIKGREDIYTWLPEPKGLYAPAFHQGSPNDFSFQIANWIRKFGTFDKDAFSTTMVMRLKKWGFNSYGAFSGNSQLMPYTPMIPKKWYVPSKLMGEFPDPYDPTVIQKIDEVFAQTVKSRAADPYIIGYFLENEQAFRDLPTQLPQLKNAQPAKLALVKFLEHRYPNIAAFNKAWSVNVADFSTLATTAVAPTTPLAMSDMHDFTREFLHTYFKLVCDTFRKYDSNHLLLGNRFLPAHASSQDYVGITAEYVDVFSINYYSYVIEKDFLRRVSRLAKGKPILLSEWSFGTSEQGLAGGVRDVSDQTERGLAYRNYVEQAAAMADANVVGIQWFSLVDQPLTGSWFQKYNGEAMNIGLLNVADRPYKDFLVQVKQTNDRIYDLILGKFTPFTYDHPRFSSRSVKRKLQAPYVGHSILVDGQFSDWTGRPSERLGDNSLVMGKSNDQSCADFWVGWDEKNLYVYLICKDPTPCANPDTTGKHLWKSDALELFLGGENVNQDGPLLPSDKQVVIGANPQINEQWYWYNATLQTPVQRAVIRHADGQGWTMEAAIPWKAIGVEAKAGLQIRFDLAVDESDGGSRRERQFMFSGNERNNSDRSEWGVLQLVN